MQDPSLVMRSILDDLLLGALRDVGGGLLVAPLVAPERNVDADLLEEARHELTELDDAGVVNAIRVRNFGNRPLLLLDGEEVVGAKQNRIFNASFLVPPGVTVEVPVSCVEQGRWERRSATFAPASRTVSTEIRASKLRRVTSSALRASNYDAGQRAVWQDVDAHLRRTSTRSPTSAYADAVASAASRTAERLPALAPHGDQVGHVALRGGRVQCIELLGSSALYARAWRKLARGLLADPDSPSSDPARARKVAARALDALRGVSFESRPAPGGGQTLHVDTEALVAGALVHEGHAYHLLATTPA